MTYAASLNAGEPSSGEILWGDCCRVGDEKVRPTSPIPWLRLAIGLFVAAQTMTLAIAINHTPPTEQGVKLTLQAGMLAATLLVLGLLGWPLACQAIRHARQRRVTMEALFVVCLLGTFALSCLSLVTGEGPVYFEVVSILLIVYSVGRAVSAHSRAKALSTLHELTDTLSVARCVTVVDGQEVERSVDLSALAAGDQIRVLPGELIPVDGRVQQGQAFIRETSFTGEWDGSIRFSPPC
jgi:cation transport ATPase